MVRQENVKELISFAILLLFSISSVQPMTRAQQEQMPDDPLALLRAGQDQKKALKFGEAIYQAVGSGNTFMVVTEAGNVIIDTSLPFNAARHKQLLQAESAGPVRYIILTHAHVDHSGGVSVWKQPGTKIIAQKNHAEFQHYQTRLNAFFARRNAAQFSLRIPDPGPWPGNYAAKIQPSIMFDDKYEFELGGVKFEIFSTPGETPDHATVWIPKYKAAFIGDNFYTSFPNIYTLRGTRPRWALDYVDSLNKVLALKPEIVLPGHGAPIVGNAEIVKQLTRYRDAIQYVHDETVKGMNAGKDVWTLMGEIKLPPGLDVGESYGKLNWSVRGIYEGYAGWFDLNPATMYEKPVSSVYSDIVNLAGGPDAVARLAMERAQAGQAVEALHLSDVALAADPNHKLSLEAKLKALETLRSRCRNSNERGWLEFSVNQVKSKLGVKP
jgi:alkyl sulfatase BDS1-like metallo-beta-lactamase superfamily hydrolase